MSNTSLAGLDHPVKITYRSEDGSVDLELLGDRENLWLDLSQLALLFETEEEVLSAIIEDSLDQAEWGESGSNLIKAGLDEEGVTPDSAEPLYSLDVFIGLGFKLSSQKAVQFRQWALRILRSYLEQGFVVDARRMRDVASVNTILKRALATSMEPQIKADFLELLDKYEHALTLLDRYDHGKLDAREDALVHRERPEIYRLTYEDARAQVTRWKQSRYGPDREPLEGTPAYKLDLFGVEKDGSFKASIESIYVSWGGAEIYPSLEEKAANLLYFLVKNHAFSDGNKRIAAGLFLYFLDRNEALYRPDGSKRLPDNALVALTLFIAMSPPDQQDAVVAMTVNLINERN